MLQHVGDLDRLGEAQTILVILIDRVADADRVIAADFSADFLMGHAQEAHPVFKRAAEFVRAAVDNRRQELPDQMAAGHRLDTVEPTFSRPPRRLAELTHDARDIVAVHLMGEVAVIVLAGMGGTERGEPRTDGGIRATPDMRDLAHERRTVAMDALGEGAEQRDDRIVRYVELRAAPARIGRDAGRAAEHRQRKPAPRLFLMIMLIGFQRMSALIKRGLVAGAHYPVAQGEPAKLQRQQQRIDPASRHRGCLFFHTRSLPTMPDRGLCAWHRRIASAGG